MWLVAQAESIGFAEIFYIGLISVIPLFLVFAWGHKKRSGTFMPSVSPSDLKIAHLIRFISVLAFLGLVLTALSLDLSGRVVQKKTGLVLYAIDESRSQSAEDSRGISRIERARQAAIKLDDFPYSTVSVYGFTDRAFSHSSFSDDHEHFRKTVEYLAAIEAVPGTGTDLGFAISNMLDAIAEALKNLDKKTALIVLLSDGENIGSNEHLLRAMNLAQRNKVKIIVVGVGEDEPNRIPIYGDDGEFAGYEKDPKGNDYITSLNEENLRFIAEQSDGLYAREWEIDKARNFLRESLQDAQVEIDSAYNPIVSYLLLAAIFPLVVLIRYTKP